MMFGFGDDRNPIQETVDLMEELVTEYIQQTTLEAQTSGLKRTKVGVEDIKFAIRKDRKKLARANELIQMHEEIKTTRKAFDQSKIQVLASNQ